MLPAWWGKVLGFVCLGLWIGLMIAGLWPFNFFPTNQVSWESSGYGVHFEDYGEIYSPGAWIIWPTDGVSFELWLSSDQQYRAFVPILSIDNPSRPKNFLVEQFRSNLIVEGRFHDIHRGIVSERLWMDDAMLGGKPRFLTVTSGQQGTSVYLEGVLQRAYPSLRLSAADITGQLLLGHPKEGHQEWNGDLFGLAYYGRSLMAEEVSQHYQQWIKSKTEGLAAKGENAGVYPFDEGGGRVVHDHANKMANLEIPERFHVLHKAALEFPAKPNRSDLIDGVVNVLGFIPFGFLVTMYLQEAKNYSRAPAIWAAILLGGVTSLAIEVLQIYLPTRDSSRLDLMNNIGGCALGAVIPYRWFLRYLPFSNGSRPPMN